MFLYNLIKKQLYNPQIIISILEFELQQYLRLNYPHENVRCE